MKGLINKMKRIFSLFLSLVLISSMVLGTITVNVFAEVTGGYFLNNAGEAVKEFDEDFNTWRNEYWSSKTANNSAYIDSQSSQSFSVASRATYGGSTAGSKMPPTEIINRTLDGSDRYLKIHDKAGDGITHGRFLFNLGGANFKKATDDETVHMSVKFMTEDSNYRKIFGTTNHLNFDVFGDITNIAEFTSDGMITMLGKSIKSYNTGVWYKLDYLWKDGVANCYIDDIFVRSCASTFGGILNQNIREQIGFCISHKKSNKAREDLYEPDVVDASLCVDDFKMLIYNDSNMVTSKPTIKSIGSDGMVSYDADKIKFVLSSGLPKLEASYLNFTEGANEAQKLADRVTVSDGDNGEKIVTAYLKDGVSLTPFAKYKLEIDTACFSDGKYELDANGLPKNVTAISGNFEVTPAPLSLKTPEFTPDGDDLKVSTILVNSSPTADPVNAMFLTVKRNDAGAVTSIVKNYYTVSSLDGAMGKNIDITISDFTEGTAELIMVDSAALTPIFSGGHTFEYGIGEVSDTPVGTTDADANEITFGTYSNNKLTVNLNTGSDAAADGVIYVYTKDGDTIDDLKYADFVTTANDGTLTTDISFEDIELTSGEYTVAFYTDGRAPLKSDFRIITDDYNKLASIVSVDDDNVVASGVKTFAFELDKAMPNLTEDYIYITKSDGSEPNRATSVTSDGGKLIVTLEEALDPWSNYFLVIDSQYYKDYQKESISSYLVGVESAAKSFTTPHAPVDLRVKDIDDSNGKITYDVVASDATPMVFIYTNTDNTGLIKEIKSDADDISIEETRTLTPDKSYTTGDKAKFFVINSWDNPVPLFNKSYVKEKGGEISAIAECAPSDKAKTNEMVIDSFDYDNKAVTIHLNAGEATEGVLYIYKRNTDLKSTLEYVDYLVTASDGTLKITAKLRSDISDVDGEYMAAFYSKDAAKIENGFAIYDSESAAAADLGTIEFDMTGKDATTAYRVITKDKDGKDVEAPYSYYPGYLGNTAYFFRMANATAVGTTVLSSGETVAVQRANKSGNTEKNPSTYGNVYLSNQNASNPAAKTSGKYVITGSVYVSSDGYTKANATFDRNGTYEKVVPIWSNPLTKHTWYDFEIVVDMDAETGDNIFTKLIASDGSVLETNSARFAGPQVGSFRLDIATTEKLHSNFIAYKNLRLISFTGAEKPVIRYIDTDKDDILSSGEKNITFKLSEDIGFTKDNIRVIDDNGNIIGTSKIVSSKMDIGDLLATVELEKALSSNMNYTLSIDPVTYEDYAEYVGGQYVNTLNIERVFTTHKADFDMYEVDFTSGTVTGKIDNANTTEVANVNLIYTVCSSDGVMKDVDTSVKRVIGAGATASSVSATQTAVSSDTLKLFAVESLNNPVPLFGKYWTENYDGTKPVPEFPQSTEKAQANTISFDTYDFDTNFDHTNKRIVVNLNTGKNAPVSGILYIYNDSYALSDGNFIYADYVTTASNGTWAKEIKFGTNIPDTNAKYKVAFYSTELADAITNTFDVYTTVVTDKKDYTSVNYLNYRRNKIHEYAIANDTYAGLKYDITGTDEDDKVVTAAWSIFKEDITSAVLSKYESVNKNQVYLDLFSRLGNISTYKALCAEFESVVNAQPLTETPVVVPPANDTANPGTPQTSMTVTPSGGSTGGSVGGSAGGAAVGGTASIFTDMSGHWAQKHAEALVAKGVINGYADGSFRGDNPITRAELTKIIVEALEVPDGDGKAFYDVNASSWYAGYVSKAAAAGVINGFEDGSFGPDRYVSRQDAVLMIYRAMSLTEELPEGFKYFADEKDIQDYASYAIRTLADLGIINGSGDAMFLPKNNITRAEMAAVICRSLDYMQSHLQ